MKKKVKGGGLIGAMGGRGLEECFSRASAIFIINGYMGVKGAFSGRVFRVGGSIGSNDPVIFTSCFVLFFVGVSFFITDFDCMCSSLRFFVGIIIVTTATQWVSKVRFFVIRIL